MKNEDRIFPFFMELHNRIIKEDFVIDKSGVKTVELIAPRIELDPRQKLLDFGARKTPEKYAEKELKWYDSCDPNIKGWVDDIEIWKRCADRNGYVNSNYGYLIYDKNNFEQHKNCLRSLKNNKYSRQAIMIYNRPSMHYDYKSHGMSDFTCFSGETIIKSPEGDIQIKNLVEKLNKGEKYPVFSVNFETNEREIKWAIKGKNNGKRKILRVNLDNGEYIDTTEDHIFYLRKQTGYRHTTAVSYNNEVYAKDLKPDDRFITSMIYKNGNGLCYKKHLHGNFNYQERTLIHRDYYEFINNKKLSSEFDIHHKDENPLNNSILNLEKIYYKKHRSLHMKKNNPAFKETNNQRKDRIKKMKKSLKENFKNRDLSWYENKNNITFEECIELGKKCLNDIGEISSRKFHQWLKDINETRAIFRIIKIALSGKDKTNHTYFNKFKELVYNNHKVISIEYLNKEVDVYDIEVEDNHNFFVGESGVLVHNCTMFNHFMIRNDKLISIYSMRSNDAIYGFFNDFYWACTVYERLFDELKETYPKLKDGYLLWIADSFHLYEKHFSMLKDIIIEYPKKREKEALNISLYKAYEENRDYDIKNGGD